VSFDDFLIVRKPWRLYLTPFARLKLNEISPERSAVSDSQTCKRAVEFVAVHWGTCSLLPMRQTCGANALDFLMNAASLGLRFEES
jgi:hypothetical protein